MSMFKRTRIKFYRWRVRTLRDTYSRYFLRGDVAGASSLAAYLFAAEDRLAELEQRDNHPSNGSEALLGPTPERVESLFEALTLSGEYRDILPELIAIDEKVGNDRG